MKYNLPCEIVNDLLPSYIDGITEDITNQAVEEHLQNCEKCSAVLNRMKGSVVPESVEESIQNQREIDYLRKVRIKSRIPLVILTVIFTIVIFSVLSLAGMFNGNSIHLSQKQIDSLSEQLAIQDYDDYYEEYLPSAAEAGIKIFGAEKSGDIGYIYGYAATSTYVKFKNKAYDVSGGSGFFKVKVEFLEEEVRIVENYGDGITNEWIEDEFPMWCYLKSSFYDPFDSSGLCKVQKYADERIEEKWNVKVNHDDIFDISDNGDYKIYSIVDTEDGMSVDTVYKETGKLERKK